MHVHVFQLRHLGDVRRCLPEVLFVFSVSANRFYAHVYLVLYSGLSMLEHINLRKASLVCNVNLAAIGKRYHIPDIIIMRSATNYLGYKEPPYSPSALRVVLE